MARYAQVLNGVVIAFVEWDGEAEFPQDDGVTLHLVDPTTRIYVGDTVETQTN